MRASPRHLYQSLHPVLLQLPAQDPEIAVRLGVVSVDRHPLRALRLRVDRVKTDREFTYQMLPNGLNVQGQAFFGLETPCLIEEVLARFGMPLIRKTTSSRVPYLPL